MVSVEAHTQIARSLVVQNNDVYLKLIAIRQGAINALKHCSNDESIKTNLEIIELTGKMLSDMINVD
jgi:hypothetical protein